MQGLAKGWESFQDWLREGANAPLLVAMLLLCWLLLLVRRREDESRKPRRPEPVSLDELGRLAFQAALSGDPHLWRDLFVNGAEARRLLGEQAGAFLETRSPEVLAKVLATVAPDVPTGSVYAGVDTDDRGVHALRVRYPNGREADVVIGRAVQVGMAWRLWGGDPQVIQDRKSA